MTGKMSTFGGSDDKGMKKVEGLALYEHLECDSRPDLFMPRSIDHALGASQRLRSDALYFAYRFPKGNRKSYQDIPWRLKNPRNGKKVVASLVDWGPNERTDRIFDVSLKVAELLELKTDDMIEGIALV